MPQMCPKAKNKVGFSSREMNPRWNNGKSVTDGYSVIKKPNHSRASKRGYVYEHILIAEKALGKPLPDGAIVHHHDSKNNNGPLVICQDENYHRLLHQRMRALESCGHANWKRCGYCKKYDNPTNMKGGGTGSFRHRTCATAYNTELNKRKKTSTQIEEEANV